VGLWSDHGVVHVRDVARQLLRVLDVAHGLLIPTRDAGRFEFMRACGVMLAYVHDIGMLDFSPFGRAMHPEYAAQAVMGVEFDGVIAAICAEDGNRVIRRLSDLYQRGVLHASPPQILRELLAMSMCHSKSKVPVELLNSPGELRVRLFHAVTTELRQLYHEQQANMDGPLLSASEMGASFDWLVCDHPAVRDLAADVLDTLRALRAADSLRQRGTVLKTSGNYEIMIDRRTANAIWALRLGQEQLFLLESDDPLAAGEANIASSSLDGDGSLRIVFQRGAFWEQGAVLRAARNAAQVVDDIQRDVIQSFLRPERADSLLSCEEIPILLEGTDDNLEFTELVRQELLRRDPGLRNPMRCVPSLHNASASEITRYLEGRRLDWPEQQLQELIERVAASGNKTASIDLVHAFQDVRLISLAPSQILIDAGSPAAFVYIPLGDGLQVIPLGGYASFSVSPWMPLGSTGVIRGAARNADIVAGEAVELLMIPQEIYLRNWHQPYTPEELRRVFAERV
jgi:hypothetical protein